MSNAGIYFCNDFTNMPIVPFFASWSVSTLPAFVALCAGAFVLGLARRALARLRTDFVAAAVLRGAAAAVAAPEEDEDDGTAASLNGAADKMLLLAGAGRRGGPATAGGGGGSALGPLLPSCSRRLAPLARVLPPALLRVTDALLFAAVATAGWLAMVLVMSMNAWLLVAVVAGEVTGTVLFEAPGGGRSGGSVSRDGACH